MTKQTNRLHKANSSVIRPSIRKKFPIFAQHPTTIFFDNASTTHKPKPVIDTIKNFYTKNCSNAGRGSYFMSNVLERNIGSTRACVANFLGASQEEVVFTSGATESLNLVALSWGLHYLRDGDEVMLCYEDHKSTVLPWVNLQLTLSRFGIKIKIVPIRIHPEGDYDLESIKEGLSKRTRLLALTHTHHVFGMDMEIEKIRQLVGREVLLTVDVSQSVGHRPVSVKDLDADFLSFSGHKMFAAMGVGVLYVNERLHNQLHPAMVGGGMAVNIQASNVDCPLSMLDTGLHSMLEAGTQNIPAILSLLPAIEFISTIGIVNIEQRLHQLTKYLYDQLKTLPGIEFSPGVDRCNCERGFGVISFRFEHVATSDLAAVFASEKINVRTNAQCIPARLAGDNYIRASLHIYNFEDEIDRFVKALRASVG